MHHYKSIESLGHPNHLFDCPEEIFFGFKLFFDQMDDDFRVGLADEFMAFNLLLEFLIIVDDAVMNESELSRTVKMGVGIGDGNATVSRPAGMTDTHVALGQGRLTDRDLADLVLRSKPSPAFDGDAPGVVTAIFELL